MKIVLANRDYGPEDRSQGWGAHMTSEGMELQHGFEAAGWVLAGAGYGDGMRNVAALLDRWQPSAVVVVDKRDWDPQNTDCYNKNVGFTRLSELAKHPDIFKVAVIKDAGSMLNYHRTFAEEIQADAILTYYHDQSVLRAAPWMQPYTLVRTYHTIDADFVSQMNLHLKRGRAVVSGAQNSEVYPLRWFVTHSNLADVLRHPGYGNKGCHTPGYLRAIADYRVHVATASRYGFALRKIIESVAVGTTPITNLPAYDRLPEIDGALVRISSAATAAEIREAIDKADREWDLEERLKYAQRVWEWYDYRAMGRRDDILITSAQLQRELCR